MLCADIIKTSYALTRCSEHPAHGPIGQVWGDNVGRFYRMGMGTNLVSFLCLTSTSFIFSWIWEENAFFLSNSTTLSKTNRFLFPHSPNNRVSLPQPILNILYPSYRNTSYASTPFPPYPVTSTRKQTST